MTDNGISVDALENLIRMANKKEKVVCSGTSTDIDLIYDVICKGLIPDLYVMNGRLIRVEKVSGAHGAGLGLIDITHEVLLRLLQKHVEMVVYKKVTQGNLSFGLAEAPGEPKQNHLKSVLTHTDWPGVPELLGVATTPFFGPSGSLCQRKGYDPATKFFYDPDFTIPEIPDVPSRESVEDAKRFLLEELLVDFPWVSNSDRANYIALLLTPLLRGYVQQAFPLGAISATNQGSGKTLLAEIAGSVYTWNSLTWPGSDEELRKVITSTLSGGAQPIVLFDNIPESKTVDYPSLAKLLTGSRWDDRRLGTNSMFVGRNDRLWLVTGNNITLGGDMRTRTVLVELEPKDAEPALRTGFKLGNLEMWLGRSENRVQLLTALLTLAQGWFASERKVPSELPAMRSFTHWVQTVGGILKDAGIDGFLGAQERLSDADDEESMWIAFLATWHDIHGSKRMRMGELLEDNWVAEGKWHDNFITDPKTGRKPDTSMALGFLLKKHVGRFYGGYQVQKGPMISHANTYYVTQGGSDSKG